MLSKLFVRRYLFSGRKSAVKTLSLISVFGITLGVTTMIVVLSVMNGFDRSIEERILNAMPHLTVKTDSSDLKKYLLNLEPGFDVYSKQDVLIRTIEGIYSGAIAEGLEAQGLEKLNSRVSQGVELVESTTGVITATKSKEISGGVHLGKREIAMGYDLARSLGILENDEITMISPESLLSPDEVPVYEKFQVKALIKSDVADIDSRFVFFNESYYPLRFKDAASLERGLEIRFKNPYKAISLAEELRSKGIKNVQTWQDQNKALFYSLKMEKRLMGIFLALTVLISCFSIMSVLYLMVTEKRVDVGILKAMGAKKNQITQIFIRIGFAIGMGGVVFGGVLGLTICYLLVKYPLIQLPDVYVDTRFPVLVEPNVIFGIFILGLLMTFVSSYFPARQAATPDPVEILRND